jgi:hypothetical protein
VRRIPTAREAREAVVQTARVSEAGLWSWSHPDDRDPMWHTEAHALEVAQACLYLGVPVTDVVSSTAWLTLLRLVAELEQRHAVHYHVANFLHPSSDTVVSPTESG